MRNMMMMKKLLISIGVMLLLAVEIAKSQQEPQYSQYIFNMMSVNPAYTGTTEALNALMISRLQWIGLEGAPRSQTFAMHTPIKDRTIGVGASVIVDNIGPVTNTYMTLNYAHRIKLGEKVTLSLGLKAGIYNYYVGLTEIDLNHSDDAFSQDYKKNFQPNLGAGAYLYTDDYYVGVSAPKLINTDLGEAVEPGDVPTGLKRHFFITAGYVYALNSDWKIKPSILNKMVEGAPPSMDLTAQVLYKDQFWVGTTYRVGDAVAVLFEMKVYRQLTVGYSYDFTVSGLNNVSTGSHELLVSYDFSGFSNDKVKSPRYF